MKIIKSAKGKKCVDLRETCLALQAQKNRKVSEGSLVVPFRGCPQEKVARPWKCTWPIMTGIFLLQTWTHQAD